MLVPKDHRTLTFGDVLVLAGTVALLFVFAGQLLGCDSEPLPLGLDASPAAASDASPTCSLDVHWQRCARTPGAAYCWTGPADIGSAAGVDGAHTQVTGCIVPDVTGDLLCAEACK